MSLGEVEELDGGWMQVNVKSALKAFVSGIQLQRFSWVSHLDSSDNVGLGDFMVASINDALGFGPTELGRTNGSPEDSLTTTSRVAEFY